ncbi:MAG: HAD family hydrolase [Proteobacteria bacterium]|nr:HAD family hydrolase [Pseudomonadota bacterium]
MPTAPQGPADLPWLPRLSPQFRADLAALEASPPADWGLALRALATQHIGLTQATALASSLARLQQAHGGNGSLTGLRLGLASNATVDFLKPMLTASALRHGLALEVISGDFGQVAQQAMDPQSTINRARPDAVLIAVSQAGLPLRAGAAWPPFAAAPALAELGAIRDGFRSHSGALCLVQNLPTPPQLLFGSLDAATRGTLRAETTAFNRALAADVGKHGDLLIDVEWLAQYLGLTRWYDERQWHMARLPCALAALPLYADFVARALGALRGKARKCLVLDLDNTLWGGVIGDDGLDGIFLNVGDARGEAFREIQQTALDLRSRGVVLAVCSKNDDATARAPFREHPGMLLKESDIAVFMANWDDKATNIERIARQLELGLDAMVLLDDNPAERAQVRAALPQVAVPEPGGDPSAYPAQLLAAGYFESAGFTAEDLARAADYQANAARAQMLTGARNLDDFLRTLQMRIAFAPFDLQGRKRITQLINKTNQFNVTTPRYTEQQVAGFQESAHHYTLQVRLTDKFGDNGMIGVVICEKQPREWRIDTWLMSCRVLNRGVEQAICNRLAVDAAAAGAQRLVGTIIPTARNGIVRDLYQRLGFAQPASDAQAWTLELSQYRPHATWMSPDETRGAQASA